MFFILGRMKQQKFFAEKDGARGDHYLSTPRWLWPTPSLSVCSRSSPPPPRSCTVLGAAICSSAAHTDATTRRWRRRCLWRRHHRSTRTLLQRRSTRQSERSRWRVGPCTIFMLFHLPYISPISPRGPCTHLPTSSYLPYISPISPLFLPYISQVGPCTTSTPTSSSASARTS